MSWQCVLLNPLANMENGVLVDSSVFIHLLRHDIDPVVALQEEFTSLDLVTCGIVKVEVLRGVKNPKVRERLEDLMSILRFVPSDNTLWDAATDLAWAMDRAGQVIPATDILIAVSAQRIGASVLTLDHHFSMIPRLSMAKFPESWR